MTLKAKVAQFIRQGQHSFNEWTEFQKTTPEIRLKRLAKGQVTLNLNGKEGFSDPETWLRNYEAGQKINVTQAIRNAIEGLDNTDILMAVRDGGLDAVPVDEVKQRVENSWLEGYRKACDQLVFRISASAQRELKRQPDKDYHHIGMSMIQLMRMAAKIVGHDESEVNSWSDEEITHWFVDYLNPEDS